MDSYTDALLDSLAGALAALCPKGAVSIALNDAHGALVECARAGRTPLAAFLSWHDSRRDAAGSIVEQHGSIVEQHGSIVEQHDGGYVIQAALRGRHARPLGAVRVALPEAPAAAIVATVQSLADHAGLVVEQGILHQELQHSFNQLFIVYEAGRLLNLSHAAEDVLSHVVGLLERTLHFPYCGVMLLDDGVLTPAAYRGLDAAWASGARLPLGEAFAARVVEAGAAAQLDGADEPSGLLLPILESGAPPASLLCAPLTTRAGTLGFLEVYRPTATPFSDDEMFVVSVLAVEMAAALENARLYEALREREERLTQYAAKLVNSQEEERRRISRDIHDGLGQMIVSAMQYLHAHEYALPAGHPKEAFVRGMAVLQECVAETRRVMSDLRPSILDDFGLVVALQQQLDAVAQQAGWRAHYEIEGAVTRLTPAVETTIFRVVQEALNNARKHAGTDRVAVKLARHGDTAVVEVRDWGHGFEVAGVAARPERGEHLGLMGMRERVSLLGGTVEIVSAPGDGTTVRIELPAG